LNGGELLLKALASLRAQTVPTDVVVVDNGSSDGSPGQMRAQFPEVQVVQLQENIGFGRALNLAVRTHPGDPIVFLNGDTEAEPDFMAALLDELGTATEMVAAVLLQRHKPWLIDSAGVIADKTLMGFDYMHGEPVEAAIDAPAPLGPSGGAALFRLDAFEGAGGFDERIFAYYEDLDLALQLRAAGANCRLAPYARALHHHSATLGAGSAAKYRLTGWSRGYMLRRYGVMRNPRLALRVLACEGAICAGQLIFDRALTGLTQRLAGWQAGRSLGGRRAPDDGLIDISARRALQLRQRRRGF
jgi:N-acetylglucosaminyl-diphospho-decaprenol L-rhamnosyltransferase